MRHRPRPLVISPLVIAVAPVLLLAAHLGVFRIDEDGVPTRVADRWQDRQRTS